MTARWLAPVAAALDATDRPCPVFFRDDDAGWDDQALLAVLDLFERRAVPLDVAVIPKALTACLADELARRAGRGALRLHQHGYGHVNHEATGRACEFGAGRAAEEQEHDIAAGRDLLLDLLDRAVVDPVFTPPWNRCSEATVEALRAHGFAGLSRDSTAAPLRLAGLVEVPVTVDWSGRRKGVPVTAHELAVRLAAAVEGGGPVGVMLHHAVLDDAGRRAVDDLLVLLCSHPAATMTTISALAGLTAGQGLAREC